MWPYISLNFYTKERENATTKIINDKTPYVWSNKFTQPLVVMIETFRRSAKKSPLGVFCAVS